MEAKRTICVEVDGIEYESAELKLIAEDCGYFGDEYAARLKGFPECFGTGETIKELERNFRNAIKEELGRSEKLASQILAVEIQQAYPRHNKPEEKQSGRRKIGVRAKKARNIFAGRVPAGTDVLIMPVRELELGNEAMDKMVYFASMHSSWLGGLKGIAGLIEENKCHLRLLLDLVEGVSESTDSLMKIIRLRQRVGQAVVEIIAQPLSLEGKVKTLITDEAGCLNDYVYVTTNRGRR